MRTTSITQPRKEWLPFAATNAAHLHALLALTAYHLHQLGEGYDPLIAAALDHKGKAIRLLRDSLQDFVHDQSYSVLCTVATLTQIEVSCLWQVPDTTEIILTSRRDLSEARNLPMLT